MQAITEKGGEGVTGKGREEDERGDGVRQAVVCLDLVKSSISIHCQIDCFIGRLHMVPMHRRSRHSYQN